MPSSITEATIKEGSSTAGQINATDVDGLTNSSVYKIINGHQPAHGTATVDPTRGIWIYTPHLTFDGEDGFKITITDDLGSQYIQDVSIVIEAQDHPGILKGDLHGSGNEDTSSKES